eukprot:CAMPEP_0206207302 /NCGR_PEP_ID=MMETSP0166-20121206/15513_1 /ASSEMBLY_ACC=CAM_ASM_000260 /TAXON_ID=95228 /ORGANISM="Vannella robusta, Strain DIVA3 518/3/11/1/6" /LENGTH=332 /DNA_ID=CAMNT_0053628043 /DNA_START=244 /DNA_END=1242 /DNA_ORIENTATION=+
MAAAGVKAGLELTKLVFELVKSAVEAGNSIYEAHKSYKEVKGRCSNKNSSSGSSSPSLLTPKQQKKAEEEYEKALASLVPLTDHEGAMSGEMKLKTIGIYYKGVFVDEELEGYGEMRTPDTTYIGHFHEGLPHGEGKMTYTKSGSVMIGNFEGGFLCGQGQTITLKGTLFAGTYENNQLIEGTAITNSGVEVVGRFHNFQPIEGEATYSTGLVYKGRMKDWKWHDDTGTATLTFPKRNKKTGAPYKASYYRGEFKDCKFDGYGEMGWKNGRAWAGQWVANEMQPETGKYGKIGDFQRKEKLVDENLDSIDKQESADSITIPEDDTDSSTAKE